MALIVLHVFIVFTVSSSDFHQVKLPWLHRQCEWPKFTRPQSLDYQVGAMLESYHNLQPKPKAVAEFKMPFSWLGLPYWRNPLTTLWKSTASDCWHVSANGGHFEHDNLKNIILTVIFSP